MLNLGCRAVARKFAANGANSLWVIPAWVAKASFRTSGMLMCASISLSFSRTAWNGCVLFHPGCCGASSAMRAKMNATWKYIGFSAHSVPSLSNVAMRSAGATNSGLSGVVTPRTKSKIFCFVAPSVQDGSGSEAEGDQAQPPKMVVAIRASRVLRISRVILGAGGETFLRYL